METNKETKEKKCEHCEFIERLGNYLRECPDGMTNREYWILTEIYVYLHNGKDYCYVYRDKW